MHRPVDTDDTVARPDVARLADELRDTLARLHSGVRVTESSVDLVAEFRGVTFCRVAPYREVLHVQVGNDPVWESRIRTADELADVTARIVRAFLHVFADEPAGSP
ncbi:MAG TPA: hypothetical protein VFH88_02935 [Candidatus Krumholzibacteria bacterium]|nr:hypothetical protein [Candidatus Krumholzibacteria bacterium]